MKEYEQINIVTIIVCSIILLFIPKMLYRPGLILTCLFFIALSTFLLCCTWIFRSASDLFSASLLFIPVCFIISTIFKCCSVIYKNKEKIQNENTHIYYEKFITTTIWLICIELVFYYYLYQSMLNGDSTTGLYISSIILFCILNYFVIRFNSIYFTYFSADG
jgi:hypothetical protein